MSTKNISARFSYLDADSMTSNGDDFRVLVVAAGAIERVAGQGLDVKADGITDAMIANYEDIVYRDEVRTITALHTYSTLPQSSVAPVSGDDLTNKDYVDTVAQGLSSKGSVRASTTAALAACTYDNGTAGVGATLTGDSNGALAAQDGITLIADELLLVKDQASGLQNGVYVVTQVGTAGTPFILTRATNNDENNEQPAAYVWIEEGSTLGDTGWLCTADNPVTMGTTSLDWSQFTGAATITAGAGLTKSGNTINLIGLDDSLTINADDVSVNVDDSTIETAGGVGIRVKAAGIDENHMVSTAFGDSLSGGSGTVIDVIVSTFLTGGSFEIDGDKIDIDFTPSNYTPSIAPAEADHLDNLSAHLSGIDTALAAIPDRRVETFTLDGTDITNEYITLANQPASPTRVTLVVRKAGGLFYGDDFQMNGGTPTRLEWTSLGLDGLLISGDKLTVTYDV